MNDIIVVPKEIDDVVVHEGIEFRDCTFIDIYIDGISIDSIADFESGVVYWQELKKSCEKSGKFLLFTCYCGQPDDAGWDYVNVEHAGSKVVWRFDRDQDSIFEFNKAEYIKQVASCESLLNLSRYPLAMPTSGLPMY